MSKICILDRTESYRLGDFKPLLVVHLDSGAAQSVGIAYDLHRPGDGFIEHRFEPDSASRSGLEGFAVGSHDRTEADVAKVGAVESDFIEHGKEFSEVFALAMIDDVERNVWRKFAFAKHRRR